MIKMTYAQLRELNFSNQLIGKLFNTPMKGKTSLKLKRIFDSLIFQSKEIQKAGAETLESQFAKKDEQGNVIRPEKDPFGFEIIEDKKEEFNQARIEFDARTFEINIGQILLDDLSEMKLSVSEISILEPLLDTGEASPSTPLRLA